MGVSFKRGSQRLAVLALTLAATALAARADEIRLKDGKKLYGVIVSYEDNMFKVKTDFGFVLVEKDKISSIIPSTPPSAKPESQPAAKKDPAAGAEPKAAPAAVSEKGAVPAATNANSKSGDAPAAREKPSPKISSAAVKPELPPPTAVRAAVAPAIKSPAAASSTSRLAAAAPAPAPPKEAEVPVNREDIQGNLYTNYTRGFRMYKAPSWKLIEEARSALPNAVVAMGTFNESTLLVIGQEKTKQSLEAAAAGVERRLHEVYENYRLISQRKTTVNGLPAIEYHYRGMADSHDWSGTLAVVARGPEVFTVLGMTYADTDLIQIQENVIARSIASLDFNVH
ncbi:MAG TPA: hypothetical protein VK525_10300 [Candidatus Saccharimonadales bacterium]|jgi:hypothetical protein|nr:hypothetical protein [Candidatus Saccharimonadales bacterium]